MIGKRIIGTHPDTYYPSPMITDRGVWVPSRSNEAMWYGLSQWMGATSQSALTYILPNLASFGCSLYSESDLFEDG